MQPSEMKSSNLGKVLPHLLVSSRRKYLAPRALHQCGITRLVVWGELARKIVLSRTSTKSYAHVTASNVKKDASTQTDSSWLQPSQKVNSNSETQTEQTIKPINTKPITNRNKNSDTDIKQSNKKKSDKKKESAIPTPHKNLNAKNNIKTYERVLKPLSPAQLKTSTESIDFPPMDVIRSAAESQETASVNGMEVVIPENSPKGKKKGKPPKLPILPPS
ncbi:hypothetical protein GQR58_002016 [Nymphon striatum]|nr:hypothetical protein GQR58_002016 [Nymphon striatum]